MMSPSRTSEILDEWRAVAGAASLPSEAPRSSRSAYPFAITGTAVAVAILLVALFARGGWSPREPSGGAIGSASTTPSATAPAAPSSTVVASPSQVPGAGGACSASQFALGEATSAPGFGTVGTTSLYVTQPLRNTGSDCVLELPTTIRVASATGPFQSVKVVNAGTATSFTIRSGQSVSIVLGAWWWTGGSTENGTQLAAPPCTDPLTDINRVEFPVAQDSIQIDLGTIWHQVCSSPASVSVTVEG